MAEIKEFIKVKTDLPYPVPVFNARITYKKAEKPSGIAYILMQFINNAGKISDKLTTVLSRIGIPEELQHIFSDELKVLMQTGVVDCKRCTWQNVQYFFEVLELNELYLTDSGKKMFREEAIPTGEDKFVSKYIYFDAVKNQLSFASLSKLLYSNTALSRDESLRKKVKADVDLDNIIEYVEQNKSGAGIDKADVILDTNIQDADWVAIKPEKNFVVTVTSEGVSFEFESRAEEAFFEKYYSSGTIEDVLYAKTKKFLFPGGIPFRELDFDWIKPENLDIPGNLQQLVDSPCSLYIGRKCEAFKRANATGYNVAIENDRSESLLSQIDDDVLFMTMDMNGDYRYFIAYRTIVPCVQFNGLVKMDIVASYIADADQKRRTNDAIKEICMRENIAPVYVNAIAFLDSTAFTDNGAVFREYIETKLNECVSVESKISVLLKIHDAMNRNNQKVEIFKEYGKILYDEFIFDTSTDNVGYKYKVLQPLSIMLGVSQYAFMADLTSSFVNDVAVLKAFDTLLSAGLKTEYVLTSLNAIKTYMSMVLNNEPISGGELAKQYDIVRNSLWKINGMLKINSYMDDLPIDDDYDVDAFLKSFSTLQKSYGELKSYRDYSKKEYEEVDFYIKMYSSISETAKIELDAQRSPDKISEKYVEGLINKGSFREAVCSLFIRLQYNLAELLGLDVGIGGAKLIEGAFKKNLINVGEKNEIDRLRICRNDYQHPRDTVRVQANSQNLRKWKELVFSIGGNK